ncbi:MAG: CspA family cold shock protein [Cryomorphaceae bacterium]|jgi:CspA family cold shock protein
MQVEKSEETLVKEGTVKFYIDEKLFGFLIDDISGDEIYVPVAGLIDEIKKGSKVYYTPSKGEKGVEAIDVRVRKKKH